MDTIDDDKGGDIEQQQPDQHQHEHNLYQYLNNRNSFITLDDTLYENIQLENDPYRVHIVAYYIENRKCIYPYLLWLLEKNTAPPPATTTPPAPTTPHYTLPSFLYAFPKSEIDVSLLDFKNSCIEKIRHILDATVIDEEGADEEGDEGEDEDINTISSVGGGGGGGGGSGGGLGVGDIYRGILSIDTTTKQIYVAIDIEKYGYSGDITNITTTNSGGGPQQPPTHMYALMDQILNIQSIWGTPVHKEHVVEWAENHPQVLYITDTKDRIMDNPYCMYLCKGDTNAYTHKNEIMTRTENDNLGYFFLFSSPYEGGGEGGDVGEGRMDIENTPPTPPTTTGGNTINDSHVFDSISRRSRSGSRNGSRNGSPTDIIPYPAHYAVFISYKQHFGQPNATATTQQNNMVKYLLGGDENEFRTKSYLMDTEMETENEEETMVVFYREKGKLFAMVKQIHLFCQI